MTIAPMSTSDRAWLWSVGADVSEGEPEAITVSVRVANADSKLMITCLSYFYIN